MYKIFKHSWKDVLYQSHKRKLKTNIESCQKHEMTIGNKRNEKEEELAETAEKHTFY